VGVVVGVCVGEVVGVVVGMGVQTVVGCEWPTPYAYFPKGQTKRSQDRPPGCDWKYPVGQLSH